ncbi:carboxylating nicotinate-nucleotide diphosphorylase [bacterium]|nr:carboxylating nicotinate-nucleotide diphosphorylase [bacterium]MBU1025252.1 carboxylating nicotinate-nucleotide diphosphorylase [bacterium]
MHVKEPDSLAYEDFIKLALKEDMPFGDITTDNLAIESKLVKARLTGHEDGILAGLSIFKRTFMLVDKDITDDNFQQYKKDGLEISAGDIIAELILPPGTLLKGERVALNLITHLSGIATLTDKFVNLVGKDGPAISDTRKTIPGLRVLQKYAVRVGGGTNHRMSLSDAVLIKNNHISLAGGIIEAVERIKARIGHTVKIEVEVSDIQGVHQALTAGVDIIMLDNFSPDKAAQASEIIGDKAVVELSGGINLDNIRDYISAGVYIISIGALTHSVKALDMSLHVVD